MGVFVGGSSLPGISEEEYAKLLLSVGHTSKARRPLSPVEVGELLLRSKRLGMSSSAMTPYLNMTDTSMPAKFIKLTELDESLQYLVCWGASGQKALGFSVAAQLSRVEPEKRPLFVEKCLLHAITKNEAVSVIQLFERSGQSLPDCFSRVVARRPTTKTLEVVIGAVASVGLTETLGRMSQLERDDLFERVVHHVYPEADKFSAKLGKNRFTIIGGKSIGRLISADEFFSKKLNENLEFTLKKGSI